MNTKLLKYYGCFKSHCESSRTIDLPNIFENRLLDGYFSNLFASLIVDNELKKVSYTDHIYIRMNNYYYNNYWCYSSRLCHASLNHVETEDVNLCSITTRYEDPYIELYE